MCCSVDPKSVENDDGDGVGGFAGIVSYQLPPRNAVSCHGDDTVQPTSTYLLDMSVRGYAENGESRHRN
jgi:hypothetical protein